LIFSKKGTHARRGGAKTALHVLTAIAGICRRSAGEKGGFSVVSAARASRGSKGKRTSAADYASWPGRIRRGLRISSGGQGDFLGLFFALERGFRLGRPGKVGPHRRSSRCSALWARLTGNKSRLGPYLCAGDVRGGPRIRVPVVCKWGGQIWV